MVPKPAHGARCPEPTRGAFGGNQSLVFGPSFTLGSGRWRGKPTLSKAVAGACGASSPDFLWPQQEGGEGGRHMAWKPTRRRKPRISTHEQYLEASAAPGGC